MAAADRLLRAARLLLATLLLLPAAPLAAQHREVRSAQLDRDGQFRIWNAAGSVHVIGWDRDSVRVEADLDDAARAGFLFGAGGEGGKLTTDSDGRAGRADLVVRIPRGATVWVKTSSADVVVNGVTGAIDVYAVTGNVHIASPSATSVYAESMGGRVHVTGRAGVVRLRTGTGSVEFSGRTEDLAVRTVSGSVLARAAGLLRGIVESVDGRVHLGLSFRPGAQLDVLTHGGAVDLTLPARTRVEWQLATVSGSIDVVEPLRRARDDTERRSRGAARRELPAGEPRGEGDVTIAVRTFSGPITLRGAE